MLNITKEEFMQIDSPHRYIGEEIGIIQKTKSEIKIRVALCYPNLYDFGMLDFDMMFLYSAINNLKNVICERCFLPFKDFEELMNSKKIPLYTLESKSNVKDFDVVMFVISNIFEYTNVIKMLELSKICETSSKKPLLIGILSKKLVNPYPMSEIFDLVIIGEYDSVYKDIFFRYGVYTSQNLGKEAFLESVSKIKSIFVKGISCTNNLKYIPVKKANNKMQYLYFPVSSIADINQKIMIRFAKDNESNIDIEKCLKYTLNVIKKSGLIDIEILVGNLTKYDKLEIFIKKLLEKDENLNIKIRNLEFNNETLNIYIITNMINSKVSFNIDKLNLNYKEILENIKLAFKNGVNNIEFNFLVDIPGETYQDLENICKFINNLNDTFYDISTSYRKQNLLLNVNFKGYVYGVDEKISSDSKLELKYKFLKDNIKNIECNFENICVSNIENIISRKDSNTFKLLVNAYKNGVSYYGNINKIDFKIWKKTLEEWK